MSIKSKVSNIADLSFLKLLQRQEKHEVTRVSLTPVFHVERLYIDSHFDELAIFCEQFQELSGARAVLTCMTPHSPILEHGLSRVGFDSERYWNRITQLKQYALIGLHGHFVRGFKNDQALPMHCSYHNLKQIQQQIDIELSALMSRSLITEKNRIYSGGWWFTSNNLRAFLSERQFTWDYTISSSRFNRSQGSDSLSLKERGGISIQKFGSSILHSPVAVASISKANRPFHAAKQIWKETRHKKECNVSLYSHDYDLHLRSAITFVERALDAGMSFSEPSAS